MSVNRSAAAGLAKPYHRLTEKPDHVPQWYSKHWLKAGDRKGALAAIPDQAVDELVVHGSPAHCRDVIDDYFRNGVTTSSLAILPLDPKMEYWTAIKDLSPSAH